ncbi:protein phosphatase 2C 77-like isoform X1 [Trifolium pratense]|nr:protein phosphatase 2C 77-like isoform X1 [Trifolium pratense]
MEEISSTVAVPLTLGNLIQKESVMTNLMANTATVLILNPTTSIEGCQSFSVGSDDNDDTDISLQHKISVSLEVKENQVAAETVAEMVLESDSNGRNDDEFMIANDFPRIHNPSSQSDVGNKIGSFKEESAISRTNLSEMNTPNTVMVDGSNHDQSVLYESVKNMASVVMKHECKPDGSDTKPIDVVHEIPEKQTCTTNCDNALELSDTPRCGFSSVCGRRQEMEDAIVVKPQLFQVPSMMLMDDHVNANTKHSLAHFFGVFDGHGGSQIVMASQVAHYCQTHLHSVLIEEIEAAESSLPETNEKENWQDQWKKVLTNCFKKVDDKIVGVNAYNGGSNSNDGSESSTEETLAPECAGSTALVAVLTQTHIIVANCGDSRAVLCRGKEALPLSTDHRPDIEDEQERIEAAGGKIIQWNGYRVLGVLAVSRSIGDRYLKPWIIPDPEVNCILREKTDECLILASDGLWDVIKNEEACEIARKRILIWHKKNGTNISTGQVDGVDPAAQYAADYLSKLALQRASKDNISVIVIDLKAQREFKRKE